MQFKRGCKRRELPDGSIYIIFIHFKISLTMNIDNYSLLERIRFQRRRLDLDIDDELI